MAENPPPYQDAIKQPTPSGVYQPQNAYGAIPQAGYAPAAVPSGRAPLPSQGGYAPIPQGGYVPPPQPAGAVPTYQYNVTVTQPATQQVVVVGKVPCLQGWCP